MEKDSVIFDLIEREHQRQVKGIELIASENFVSDEVMKAMGSVRQVAAVREIQTKEFVAGFEACHEYGHVGLGA